MPRRKIEDYAKTIYALQSKGKVRGASIARKLKVSKPTVSVTLKNMEQDGYLVKHEDHTVELTEKGTKLAEEIVGRNDAFYSLLIRLGVDKATAAEDACNMEHAISRESFQALQSLDGFTAAGENK